MVLMVLYLKYLDQYPQLILFPILQLIRFPRYMTNFYAWFCIQC